MACQKAGRGPLAEDRPSRILFVMRPASESPMIPDDQLTLEQRGDGSIVVRVRSESADGGRLPDAVFSFRCGDPQYAYWLGRLQGAEGPHAGTPPPGIRQTPGDATTGAGSHPGQPVSRRRGNSQSAR